MSGTVSVRVIKQDIFCLYIQHLFAINKQDIEGVGGFYESFKFAFVICKNLIYVLL